MFEHASIPSDLLIGTWHLISAIAILPDGTLDSEAYGCNPSGYLTYTPDGHMMVLFSRSDRPPFSQAVQSPFSEEMRSVPLEELAQAFITFNAYAGTYTVQGNTVTHHLIIASIPNRVGTDLVRTFTVNENRLTLTTASTFKNGIEQIFELVWERLLNSEEVRECQKQFTST
jgi:Lipocalin-like domain